MQCKHNREIGLWFKTKDHYLDSEYDSFVRDLKRKEIEIRKYDRRIIKLEDTKNKINITVHRHECGPEIVFETVHSLSDNIQLIISIVALINLTIKLLRKLIKDKAKENKEKPGFAVYILLNNRTIKINQFTKKSIERVLMNK